MCCFTSLYAQGDNEIDEDDVIDEMLDQQKQANKALPRGNALRVASMARKGSGAMAGASFTGASFTGSLPKSPASTSRFDWAAASAGKSPALQ